jgi:hypothetical protein
MKKEIARLGLICSLTFLTQPGFAAAVGDLLITEVMANPAALSDSQGEWFELFNPTDEPINLLGIDLGDDGSNRHRFDSDLLILPGEFLTLARSADPGFQPDYVYSNFTLSNGSDEIVLREGLVEMLRLDYGPGFSVAGRSRELEQLPMTASNYGLTLASLGYGAGDFGTPGSGVFGLPPTVSTVPLPAGLWLFASGLLAVLSAARHRTAFSLTAAGRNAAAVNTRPAPTARAGLIATPSGGAGMLS